MLRSRVMPSFAYLECHYSLSCLNTIAIHAVVYLLYMILGCFHIIIVNVALAIPTYVIIMELTKAVAMLDIKSKKVGITINIQRS